MRKELIDAFATRCTNPTQLMILQILEPTDINHRVRRSTLVDLLHMADRSIRQEIAEMRKNGIFIAGDTDRGGYYIPNSFDEFLAFEANYSGRALKILHTQSKMHNLAMELLTGQTSMEVGR